MTQLPAAGAGGQRVLVHQRTDALHDFGDLQQPLHAGQVDAQLVDEVLDEPQPLQLLAVVDAHAADRARRLDQSQPLVLAQRLRMHAEHLRRHADEIQTLFTCHTVHVTRLPQP